MQICWLVLEAPVAEALAWVGVGFPVVLWRALGRARALLG
jgi:hypothetical protein